MRRSPARDADVSPVVAAAATVLVALVVLVFTGSTARDNSPEDIAYAPAFREVAEGPGAQLNTHDGQAFGSLALDPLLSRPEDWQGGAAQMAYRASRPLLGWLVAATAFGSATVAAWSLLVWTAVGAGLTVAAAAVFARRWGRRAGWTPLLLFVPALLGQLKFGGLSDGLAAGLALLGLALWLDRRDGAAVALLCVATLFRETALLVPAALILADRGWRSLRLLAPFAVYAAWVGVVFLRLGALPTGFGPSRPGVPFVGLADAVGGWGVVGWVSVLSVLGPAVVAWVRAPSPAVRWLVVLSLAFASTFSEPVLRSWDFTRPLLPLTILGMVLLARRRSPATAPARLPERGALAPAQ